MDQTWARRTAGAALQRYGLHDADLQFVKFRENWVFRATCDGADYAVRLHRPGLHTAEAVGTELAYLSALQQRGFPVPEPVRTTDGELICAVEDGPGGTVLVCVMRWVVGGRQLGDAGAAFDGSSPITPEDLHRVGQLAGALHNHLTELGRLPGFDRDAWDGPGLLGAQALWGDPLALPALSAPDRELLSGAVDRLAADLADLGDGPDVYGVIHADLTPENVLVRGSEFVVIDFDDFGEGWHLFELATVLFFFRPHPRFAEFVDAVVSGYRTQRELDDRQLAHWTGMLLARGLTYLGWAAARPGEETAAWIAEEVVPVVVALAQEYLAERAELV
ncbi:phosphotransferase [Klenkia sp. LSe6-5]|uniref:Phosphotransferase n=1 Tax=Klenkia sesuvii TaxID=3103137 RepID=A0ABU8DRC4_9ACTN